MITTTRRPGGRRNGVRRRVIVSGIVLTAVNGGSVPSAARLETLVTVTPRVIEAIPPDDTAEQAPFYRHAGESAKLTSVVSGHPAGLWGWGMSGELKS